MFKNQRNFPLKWGLILVVLTIVLLNQSYEFALMGLTTFILAYLSKGIRRKKPTYFDNN